MIHEIKWERANLVIRADQEDLDCIYLENGKGDIIHFRHYLEGHEDSVYLNVCNAVPEGGFLPEGIWELAAPEGIPDRIVAQKDALTRVFSYGAGSHYFVSFQCEFDPERVIIKTQFVKRNKHPERRRKKQEIQRIFLQAVYRFFRLLAVFTGYKKKVCFLSQTQTEISDNMQVVLDRIHTRKLDTAYKIDTYFYSDYDKHKRFGKRIRLIRMLAGHNILFVDDYMPMLSFIRLEKNTQLIQLWHAGVGYKLVGYARFGIKGSPHPFQSCHRQYTCAIIGNEHLKEIYSEVFGVPESVFLPTGMPRLERFLDPDVRRAAEERVYKAHPELKECRVLLFAPTYRGKGQASAFYDYEQLDQQRLYEMCCRTNSILIFKWHHFITDKIQIRPEYSDRLVDYSGEDLNDLMYVSDVLITDYSSCFYDYLLLQRPIVFYLYDEERYALERGVHEKVSETAPGWICHSLDEMLKILEQKEIPRTEPLQHMVDMCLTNGSYTASDRIVDHVFGKSEEARG